jgi:molybdate transport system ATP-binding protein
LAAQCDCNRSLKAGIVSLLGLETLLTKAVKVLSAGEMRKLLIGRALMKQPRLLILDEPFNGLDAASQQQLLEILDQLGKTDIQMVLITHRPADIPSAFTHLIHLENGASRWQGPIKTFFETLMPIAPPVNPVIPPRPGHLNILAQLPSDLAPVIQMRDVCVRYGPHQVLEDITWTVQAGENWALTGPNGAGKSTLLKLITGDNLQGYANELILFGRPKGSGESVWQIKQHIGYVADDLQLRYQKKMSGFDVVCSGFFDSVGLYRRCSDTQKQIARMWLEKTGTRDLALQLFSKLSFGQQRMVLIVRAMVKTPRLLILDEPCNGLDAANRRRLLDMLDVIGRNPGTGLLYVSHRPDEIPTCITHRLYLLAGRIQKIDQCTITPSTNS